MNKQSKFFLLIVILAMLLFPVSAAASGYQDDKVIFGGNYTLKADETLNGDLVVFGGNATIESKATVNGDVVVFGGNLDSGGTINGDLAAIGGFVTLEETARVNGSLTVLGSSIDQAPGSRVQGDVVTGESFPFEFGFPPGLSLLEGDLPTFPIWRTPLLSVSWFFFQLAIWTGLAVILMLFLEDQTVRINKAAFQHPGISLLVGLGVVVIAPIVFLAFLITILLSPLSLIGIIILIGAWVLGWVSLGLEVGRRLSEALQQSWAAPITAGVGIFITLLMFNGFRQIVPCFGFFPKFVAGIWMMGAVALTRFGTQEYLPGQAAAPAPPAADIPEAFDPAGDEEETETPPEKPSLQQEAEEREEPQDM